MEKLRKYKFESLNSGKALNMEDFFNQLIKPQFKNKDQIKKIHLALLKYIELPEATLFIRLYGSFSNYDLLRRGFLTRFPDKTKMAFCDNTFSMLFTGLKLSGYTTDEKELFNFLNQEKLICSFGQTSNEKELSFYKSSGAIRVNLNTKGYYLAHIKPVGYGYSDICDRNLRTFFPNPDRKEWNIESKIRLAENNLDATQKNLIKAHFVRLVHPLNSFLVPKTKHLNYAGKNIGEELEVIKYVKKYLEEEFPVEYKEFEKITLAHEFEPTTTALENIEWFDTPIGKSKPIMEKSKKADRKKESVNLEILDNIEEEAEDKLLSWLKSIGMQVFTEIICPSILANPNITIDEISEKNAKFKQFTENSKKSRLSTSKSIYKNGLIPEALQFIIDSKNTNESTRTIASELLVSL